jgi:hypothetical protein
MIWGQHKRKDRYIKRLSERERMKEKTDIVRNSNLESERENKTDSERRKARKRRRNREKQREMKVRR